MTETRSCCLKGKKAPKKTIISSHCPCSDHKLLAAWSVEEFPLCSFPFTGEIHRPMTSMVITDTLRFQLFRPNQPPSPPPKTVIPA